MLKKIETFCAKKRVFWSYMCAVATKSEFEKKTFPKGSQQFHQFSTSFGAKSVYGWA